MPGISRILKRLKFSRKQALMFIRSPDPAYASKQAAIETALAEAAQQPGQVILLYLDELTYYRRPSKAPAYAHWATINRWPWRQPGSNTQTRIVGTLNARTGQVSYPATLQSGQSRSGDLLRATARDLSPGCQAFTSSRIIGPITSCPKCWQRWSSIASRLCFCQRMLPGSTPLKSFGSGSSSV